MKCKTKLDSASATDTEQIVFKKVTLARLGRKRIIGKKSGCYSENRKLDNAICLLLAV